MHFKALIKLSTPIELNRQIHSIQLPSDCGEDISNYYFATVVGTGDTEQNYSNDILHETEVITVSSDNCPHEYTVDSNSIICTKPTKSRGTPFHGDSGMFGSNLRNWRILEI